jgi:putative endonuclease
VRLPSVRGRRASVPRVSDDQRQRRAEAARAPRRAGVAGELAAEAFLVGAGYVPLARNHVVRGGEVDLVMRDGEVTVFVEVKQRRRADVREALESVTPRKQARVVRAALDWLARAGAAEAAVRFDVVAVGPLRRGRRECTHVPNAFDASVADERG